MRHHPVTTGEHRGILFKVLPIENYLHRTFPSEYAAMRHNGYVRLPDGHPAYSAEIACYDESVAEYIPDIHGGPTYCGPDPTPDDTSAVEGLWVGFDTAHGFDTPATQTAEYVEAECRRFINALLDGEG